MLCSLVYTQTHGWVLRTREGLISLISGQMLGMCANEKVVHSSDTQFTLGNVKTEEIKVIHSKVVSFKGTIGSKKIETQLNKVIVK